MGTVDARSIVVSKTARMKMLPCLALPFRRVALVLLFSDDLEGRESLLREHGSIAPMEMNQVMCGWIRRMCLFARLAGPLFLSDHKPIPGRNAFWVIFLGFLCPDSTPETLSLLA